MVNASDLYDAVLAWARLPRGDDAPEWAAWNTAWNDATDGTKRQVTVTLAMAVVGERTVTP